MYDKSRTEKTFSDASSQYAAHANLQARIGALLGDALNPYLTPEMILLDVGAGPGTLARGWNASTIALDAAYGMCREAGAHLPVINARAEALPIRDTSLDAVVSNVMLQWLSEPQKFFAEAARVLQPKGLLAFSTFAEGTLHELQVALAAVGEGNRMSLFTPAETIERNICKAGFTTILQQERVITEQYADLPALGAYLRNIGATNSRVDRPRGLLTPRKWREAAAQYPKSEQGIKASWHAHIVIARKL